MKTTILISSVVTALLLSGCGSASDATAVSAVSTTDITVERGPVLGATVRDSEGQIGVSKGNGVYSFKNPTYPIESFGGYIDMNRNGVVDSGDVEMNYLRLRTNAGNVMTIPTTMAQNSETRDVLLEDGFSEDELFSQTPSTDMDTAALSDEVYKYCVENNITDPADLNSTDINTLRVRIQTRKDSYNNSGLDSAELELSLVNDELNLVTMTEDDIPDENVTAEHNIIDSIPLSVLTLEQKATLAYMWDEERLARDIYLTLNDLTPSNTLYNIATNAESQHVISVESLIKKYDLNILNSVDYSGGYSAEALEAVNDNEFITPELTALYDVLYAVGSVSQEDALKVGCMVEVTDITDLDRDIEVAGDAEDIVMIFENLRKGSYSHYWAFDSALKNLGVSDGCCAVGSEYCKTAEDYPQNTKGSDASHDGTGERRRLGQH